jgi:hypothetical protein
MTIDAHHCPSLDLALDTLQILVKWIYTCQDLGLGVRHFRISEVMILPPGAAAQKSHIPFS